MNFRAIHVISMAVSTLLDEITWAPYGSPELHTPVIGTSDDCRRLDLLLDMMGTLTRMMDTRVTYVTSDGKVMREWIETILEIGTRYRKELELLERLEREIKG
jgi:hypothetical protein